MIILLSWLFFSYSVEALSDKQTYIVNTHQDRHYVVVISRQSALLSKGPQSLSIELNACTKPHFDPILGGFRSSVELSQVKSAPEKNSAFWIQNEKKKFVPSPGSNELAFLKHFPSTFLQTYEAAKAKCPNF